MKHEAVVIGVSAGGFEALSIILGQLPADFQWPILIVQHMGAHAGDFLSGHLDRLCPLSVKEAEEKEFIKPGYVYIAPGGYHMLVEDDLSLSLSVDIRVQYARPSVDVLFESAADVYRNKLIGVVLTGANSDGSMGLRMIKECGGLAIVQDPATAESSVMPAAAIKVANVDYVLPLQSIGDFLGKLEKDERVLQNIDKEEVDDE
jgi:two-component system, chemotaxis family, protein-glutamate methylesterase/glutaminase